jgi:hypothetical protein
MPFEIAGVVGTPLSLDEPTRKHIFGHYAHILVDMDPFLGVSMMKLW